MGSQEITCTTRQRSIILGSLLGDGNLYRHRDGAHYCFRVEHGLNQEKYLWWKYQELQGLTTRPPVIIGSFHLRTRKIYQRWHLATVTNPLFDWFARRFYSDGGKMVPADIQHFIDPLALAVWYMDDGHKRTDCNALRIHTNAFSVKDVCALQRVLLQKFGITTHLHHIRRNVEERTLYVPSGRDARRLVAIVRPHIHPNIQYKISLTP